MPRQCCNSPAILRHAEAETSRQADKHYGEALLVQQRRGEASGRYIFRERTAANVTKSLGRNSLKVSYIAS